MMANHSLIKPTGRVLPTLEADGRRRWLSPRLARGRYLLARRVVAYGLIGIFTLLPFLHVNGKPAILLNIVQRKFTLFGYTFLPTDTVLLAILMVSIILSIFFFTALAGRVWCGWACPQTVYMEFLFRPIERLCLGKSGIGGKPGQVAAWRMVVMYALFVLASMYLAHTFLSYFVGVHELRLWITQSPLKHPASFMITLAVTGAMLFDFVFFREQTCLIACPYGRFQSVLLDRDSLIVRYDVKRGEPRGKGKRLDSVRLPVVTERSAPAASHAPPATSPGDCVDCTMCVQVCPTGIDIRDGLQFECIACTQCIDACDAVMDKLHRPRGLIRYSSQSAAEGVRRRFLRPRVLIYGALITGLLSLLTFLIATKLPFDVHLVRQGGLPFVIAPDGLVENVMRLNVTNRGEAAQLLRIEVIESDDVTLAPQDQSVIVSPGQMVQKPIHLLAGRSAFKQGKRAAIVRVSDESGRAIERHVQLFGPGTAAGQENP